MGAAIITGVALLIAGVAEGIILGRQRRWPELVVTSFFWLFASAYAFFVIAPFELPSPSWLISETILSLQRLFVTSKQLP